MATLTYLIPVLIAISAILITYSPISPLSYTHLKDAPKLSGVFAPNNILTKNVKRYFEGRLLGAESFAKHPTTGEIYTGTADGMIWRIDPRTMSLNEIVRTGTDDEQCGKSTRMEPICGRPMGLKFDKKGRLIVADAYFGVLSIDVENKVGETLIEADNWKFFNGLDIAADGTIYFSLSSSKWHRYNYRFAVIEMLNDGVVMSYDPVSKKIETVVDNLYMPTGIRLTKNDESILISEITISRISRYSLKGAKSPGRYSIVADNLPAYIDNIQASSRGTYYLCAIVSRFSANHTVFGRTIPPLLDLFAAYPNAKRLMASVTPFWIYEFFLPKPAYFFEMEADGKILRSFDDFDGSVLRNVGDVIETEDKLFLGSVENPYLGVANLKDIL